MNSMKDSVSDMSDRSDNSYFLVRYQYRIIKIVPGSERKVLSFTGSLTR